MAQWRTVEEGEQDMTGTLSEADWTPIETGGKQVRFDKQEHDAMQQGMANQINDLAMLCRRLIYQLRNYDLRHPTAEQAEEYLKRHGLQGSPLREQEESK